MWKKKVSNIESGIKQKLRSIDWYVLKNNYCSENNLRRGEAIVENTERKKENIDKYQRNVQNMC